MKRLIAVLLVCVLALGLAACGSSPVSSQPGAPASTAEPTPTPEPTPAPTPEPPPYTPHPLTGLQKDDSYPEGQRITAVMVNNITVCRPQRGLSAADVLFEIKVEGGITRFMALYDDYNEIPMVGPVRSARDQFFRLILPYQPLYVHIGESVVQKQYIADYDYSEWNLDGNNDSKMWWRDQNRLNAGYAYEHTAYTDGEHIANYIERKGVDDRRSYNSPIFDFVHYDEPARVLTGGEADTITIRHSSSYRTRFNYNADTSKYEMSQYSGGSYSETRDENNNELLTFDNVLMLFTDIHTYPGHEAKDLQCAVYTNGVGYYYNGGRFERIRWDKGSDLNVLSLTLDSDGSPIQLNCGRTYVTVVDIDEAINMELPDAVPEAPASSAAE